MALLAATWAETFHVVALVAGVTGVRTVQVVARVAGVTDARAVQVVARVAETGVRTFSLISQAAVFATLVAPVPVQVLVTVCAATAVPVSGMARLAVEELKSVCRIVIPDGAV